MAAYLGVMLLIDMRTFNDFHSPSLGLILWSWITIWFYCI